MLPHHYFSSATIYADILINFLYNSDNADAEQNSDNFHSRAKPANIDSPLVENLRSNMSSEVDAPLHFVGSSYFSLDRIHAVFLRWRTQRYNHLLCGDNNQALFGPCLASTGKHLEMQLDSTRPIFPGFAFTVSVFKRDFYNQTVISDSSSFLKIYTSPAALSHADSGSKRPSLAAVVSGETVLQLVAGRSKVSVAVQPYVAAIYPASGRTVLAGEVLLYAEGIDDVSSIRLRYSLDNSFPLVHHLIYTMKVQDDRIVYLNTSSSESGFQFISFRVSALPFFQHSFQVHFPFAGRLQKKLQSAVATVYVRLGTYWLLTVLSLHRPTQQSGLGSARFAVLERTLSTHYTEVQLLGKVNLSWMIQQLRNVYLVQLEDCV
jgi:hypothetical protein